MMTRRLKHAVPYAVLFGAALYLVFAAGHFVFTARPGALGPDTWPKAIVFVLMAVCAYEIVRILLIRGEDGRGLDVQAKSPSGGTDSSPEPHTRHPLLLAGGIVLTFLYVLVLDTVGFFLATTLYLALFMLLGRYQKAGVIAAASVVGSIAFVFVFMKIVYVSLPLGTGPFQTLSIGILHALGIQ